MRILLILLLMSWWSLMAYGEESWSVGKTTIQGKPVIYKFMNELPEKSIRESLNWLTVVSWKYDGSIRNGMPLKEVNKSMIKLEDGLEKIEGRGKLYFDVYSATGNNLKEFVFYIADRERFMANFNVALNGHPTYPIEVNFYKDAEWADFTKLHADFDNAANKALKSDTDKTGAL